LTVSTAPAPAPASLGSVNASKKETSEGGVSSMSRDDLIEMLEMNKDLCVRGSLSEKGILHAFAKFQEVNKAYNRLQNMKSWPGKKPLRLAIIELCMSKSQFYDDFNPIFTEALKYPDVIEWLKQTDDCPSGYELFGEEKAFYTKPDLERWIERKKKGKGKERSRKQKSKVDESSKKSHKKL
jgi:hypothetical protein